MVNLLIVYPRAELYTRSMIGDAPHSLSLDETPSIKDPGIKSSSSQLQPLQYAGLIMWSLLNGICKCLWLRNDTLNTSCVISRLDLWSKYVNHSRSNGVHNWKWPIWIPKEKDIFTSTSYKFCISIWIL